MPNQTPINELSLVPNLGLGTGGTVSPVGTVSTSSSQGLNKPGSKAQTIAKTTQALTRQINDIAAKIAAAKEKAASAGAAEQKTLLQSVTLLQRQLQQLMSSENEETTKKAINNNMTKKSLKFKNKKQIKEAILPAVGKAASSVVKTAGNIAGMVPVVGAPVKAAADLAGDVTTGVLGGEDEESNSSLTPIQDEVVNALSRKKYHVNKVSYQFADEEGGPTVYMSKRPNKYSTRYAEVSPDGLVNGMSLKEFFGSEENEERVLTKKQQELAQAAPPHDKITGADFAALKAMKKEGVEIPNFLKAILRKNYAQADKYLGSTINEKLKGLINKAIDQTL